MNRLGVTTFVWILIVTGNTSGDIPSSSAEQDIATKESIRAASRPESQMSLLMCISVIAQTFHVPISFEWAYVDTDRGNVEIPEISFSIEPNESLSEVLDRLCVESGGRLQWGRIRGILYVRQEAGEAESLLDVPVSLNLEGVSAWEAFLTLCREINLATTSDRFVRPSAEPIQDEFYPPLELRDIKTITLELNNVSAREAACAIMAASPFQMNLWYTNHYRPGLPNPLPPKAHITLWAYDAQYNLMRSRPYPRTGTEGVIWNEESKSVLPEP